MTDFYRLTPNQQAEVVADLAREGLKHWGIEDAELSLIKYRE